MNVKEKEAIQLLLDESKKLVSKKQTQIQEIVALGDRLKNDINVIAGRISVYEELLELPEELRTAIFKVED